MRLAVLNAGTATLKAALAEPARDGMRVVARAEVALRADDVPAAVEQALAKLGAPLDGVEACAHRIVHGGRRVAPARLDAATEAEIAGLARFAPLHNQVELACVRAMRARLPERPQVAVFDTAFHATRAPESLRYALPWPLADELGLFRYGFHGIAHESLLRALARARAAEPEAQDAVTLQLGSGCSACAIRAGRSLETSMGCTPLEGLVMATRSGDVDPGVVLALLRSGRGPDQVEQLLARESGLLGLAGCADMREVLRAEAAGSERARVALALFVRRIVATCGAYLTLLDGRGALVFGGGIGARSPEIRARVADGLRAWNVVLDPDRNRSAEPGRISAPGAREVYFFPTDEETLIASATARLLEAAA